jgi:hypothetical protein
MCVCRPAPVQMLHLGYAGSMGRSLVDLHVTDRCGCSGSSSGIMSDLFQIQLAR